MEGGPVDDKRTPTPCDQFTDPPASAAGIEGPDDITIEAINARRTVGHQDSVQRGVIL
jgi:hypothetical protein